MKKILLFILVIVVVIVCWSILFHSNEPGFIKVTAKGGEAVLSARSLFGRGVSVKNAAGEVAVKPGKYNIRKINLSLEDKGETWELTSYGPWGSLNPVEIKTSETTELQFGAPLWCKANVRRRGTIVDIGYSVVGKAGEIYEPTIRKGGRRMPAPEVRILDETGKILASGKFAFG